MIAASPKLTADGVDIKIAAGKNRRYVSEFTQMIGIHLEAAEKPGYRLPDCAPIGSKSFSVLVGEDFAYSFMDSKPHIGHSAAAAGLRPVLFHLLHLFRSGLRVLSRQ